MNGRSSITIHGLRCCTAFILLGSLLVEYCAAQPATLSSQPIGKLGADENEAAFMPQQSLASRSAGDASLNAIAVISEDKLCAVGDRGCILVTSDGGRQWNLKPSPTSDNLHGVAFQGDYGIAVGGRIGNYSGLSHAVVLRSQDGGDSWEQMPVLQLARLTGVIISNSRLVVWGDTSSELSSSVFESNDSGLTWKAVPTDIGHCLAAGVSSRGDIAAIDSVGRMSFTESVQARVPALAASLRSIVHTGTRWLACGDAGQCLSSVNGSNWLPVALPLSDAARQLMRFEKLYRAPALEGSDRSHLWMCGSPGSILLHSSDAGVSWQVFATGQTLPLNDVAFIDENRGWVIGVQGTLLATRDGGKSWYPQRKQPSRVGLLTCVSSHDLVPWCPMVATAWDDRVGVACLITQPDEAIQRTDFTPSLSAQLAEVSPQLGIASHRSWTHVGDKAASDNNDAKASELRLAVEFLTWRPDVVLTSELRSTDIYQSPQRSEPSFESAMAVAANAATMLPIAQELRLENWQVSKLVAVTPPGNGQYSEQQQRMLDAPGLAIWDIMLPLPPQISQQNRSTNMRTMWSRSQAAVVHASMMGGSPPSVETTRSVSVGKLGNYQLVMGRIHRQKSLDQLAEPSDVPLEKWASDLHFLMRAFPVSEVAPALHATALRLREAEDWDRWRLALETLIARASQSDAADWARMQLLCLVGSDEMRAWVASREQAKFMQNAVSVAMTGGNSVSQATWNKSPFQSDIPGSVVTTAAAATVDVGSDPSVVSAAAVGAPISEPRMSAYASGESPIANIQDRRMVDDRRLEELFLRFEQSSPKLLARVDMQMLQACHLNAARNFQSQLQILQQLSQQTALIGWQQAAMQEVFVSQHRAEQLKWLAFAGYAAEPPILDGNLTEDCWATAPSMRLEGFSMPTADDAQDSRPDASLAERSALATQLHWSFDDKYLYVAIVSPRDPSLPIVTSTSERYYDAELSQLDHVQLILDTDRDYNTVIELQIAENGMTADRCCGIKSYNPKWHVFVKPEMAQWTAEIAIELAALTTQANLGGQAWGLSARRLRPGNSMHSWSQLRSHRPDLRGNGLLLFGPIE